jgi:hypothetical protein
VRFNELILQQEPKGRQGSHSSDDHCALLDGLRQEQKLRKTFLERSAAFRVENRMGTALLVREEERGAL